MRHIFLFIALSVITSVMGQPDAFSKVYYDYLGSVDGRQIRLTADQNFAIVGYRNNKALIIKSDSAGMPVWKKTTTNDGYSFSALVATPDSGTIAAGGNLLAKFSATGETEWSYLLSDTNLYILSLSLASNNDLLLAGYQKTSTWNVTQAFFIRMTQSGSIVLSKFYLPGSNDENAFRYLVEDPEGGILALGESFSTQSNDNEGVLICRLDAEGNPIWSKLYTDEAGLGSSFISLGMVVNNNGITVLSNHSVVGMGNGMRLFHTDLFGNLAWVNSYEINYEPFIFDTEKPVSTLITTKTGGFAFAVPGSAVSTLIETDSSGVLTRSFDAVCTSTDVVETPDTGYLLLGMGPMIYVKQQIGSEHIGLYKVDTTDSYLYCTFPAYYYSSTPSTLQTADIIVTTTSHIVIPEPGVSFADNTFDVRDGCVEGYGAVSSLPLPIFSMIPNPADHSVKLESSSGHFSGQPFSVEIFDARGVKTVSISGFRPDIHFIDTSFLSEGIYLVKLSDTKTNIVLKMLVKH